MSHVVVTGAGGFLGWHTRAALVEAGRECRSLSLGERFEPEPAAEALSGSSRVIHLAGVNRAGYDEVRNGNIRFAQQLAETLVRAAEPPKTVVYANSTQAENGSVYGEAKARAGGILEAAAERTGANFVDLRLPNLFGEHGRPFYNAVTATFCHLLAKGGEPTVQQDKALSLLHAQDAADLLIGTIEPDGQKGLEQQVTVSGLLARLVSHAAIYREGEIPDVAAKFDRDLFNTYRSYTAGGNMPIRLTRHADARGAFFEIIRSHGGAGQCSFSTTAPGISRGDHFHRRKIERFTVLAGKARISLRRLFTEQVLHFDVNGEEPVAIDMPTLWAHNVTNTGTETLYTAFWTDELFSPAAPDTIAEVV